VILSTVYGFKWNILPLSLFALAADGPVRFLNLHVLGYLGGLLLLWTFHIGLLESRKFDTYTQLTYVPDGLVTIMASTTILFHFVMLPLYLWRQWNACVGCCGIQITTAA